MSRARYARRVRIFNYVATAALNPLHCRRPDVEIRRGHPRVALKD
jgi:hypothetical protein